MAKQIPTDFFFDSVEPEREPTMLAVRREKQRRWLEVYATSGWRAACAEAGCVDRDVLRWRRTDPEFRAACEAQADSVAASLEAVADEIARGTVTATAQQVAMLQFRLRGLRPEVYRERVAVAQVGGGADDGGGDGQGGRARLLLAEWSA
jgi:hypothetical protein